MNRKWNDQHPNHLQSQRIRISRFGAALANAKVSGFQVKSGCHSAIRGEIHFANVFETRHENGRDRNHGHIVSLDMALHNGQIIFQGHHGRWFGHYARPYLRPYLVLTSTTSGTPDSEVLTNWKLNDSSFCLERFFAWTLNVRQFAILTRLKKSPNSKPTNKIQQNNPQLGPVPKTYRSAYFQLPCRDDSKFSGKNTASAMSFEQAGQTSNWASIRSLIRLRFVIGGKPSCRHPKERQFLVEWKISWQIL